MNKGKVYLVGAGPGEPTLITVRGLKMLQVADVVVYDHLVDMRLLQAARPEAEMIYVGKQAGKHVMKQTQINELLSEKAVEGKVVVRLKGGDPFVLGRGGEEAIFLREKHVDFEVVPGVTAGIAAPAYAGIPVTHRGLSSSVAFVTGHEDPSKPESSINWKNLATGVDTLVLYMGVKNLPEIAKKLIENGRSPDSPAALIRWGTQPFQQTVTGTVRDIAEKSEGMQPPAVLVVGDVVGLREHINWFESRPLFGKRIVVTRSREQAGELSALLTDLGAEVAEFPTIRISRVTDFKAIDEAIRGAGSYDWLVFLSANGVRHFFARCSEIGMDIRDLQGPKVCAIGPATGGELQARGINVACQPDKYVAEELAAAMEARGKLKGTRVLIPRSNIGREDLMKQLRKKGAEVAEVVTYVTEPEKLSPEALDQLLSRPIDMITFCSSSTVKNFVACVGKDALSKIGEWGVFASIGPITSRTAREFGLEIAVEAKEITIPGLVAAIMEYYQK